MNGSSGSTDRFFPERTDDFDKGNHSFPRRIVRCGYFHVRFVTGDPSR
jgi:hypothetical protein